MGAYINGTSKNFAEEVEKSTVPVLIDFWAEWCGPCRMVGPHIEAIATEYKGKLKVVKVNVDEEGDLAGRFGIVSIPTLMIYNAGKVVKQQAGALPKASIEKLFADLI